MSLKRPTPKTLSTEVQNVITMASASQSATQTKVRSYDPNFPVFDIPVNQRVLVYIPNHQITLPDGSMSLRMDKFAAHPVKDGRSYANVRCIKDIVSDDPALNYNGSCPLCDCMDEIWELYRKEYDDIAASKGIDPNSSEADELLKADRIELLSNRVIREPEIWYTFPIVVIECEEKDGVLTTNPKRDANGAVIGKPMWYSIRENTFLDKWVAGYDSIDTEDGTLPSSPAGLWAILNFTYTPKSGKPDKMGSAKSLKVTFKNMGDNYKPVADYFDKITEDWTPAKAQEVVVLDSIRSYEETQEAADSLMKRVRDKLYMYSVSKKGANMLPSGGAVPTAPAIGGSSADEALSNFGVTPAQGEVPSLTGAVGNVGVD